MINWPESLSAVQVVYHNLNDHHHDWILDAACQWLASIKGWEKIGSQANIRKNLIFGIHKMEVETPFSCIGQSTSDEKWGQMTQINDRIYQIDMLLPNMSRHYVGARHIFSSNEQTSSKKFAGSQKKMEMNDPTQS